MSEAELDILDAEVAAELKADEPEYTEVEQKAIDEGWNPDKGDLPEGTPFVDAEEYIKRGSFFRKIDSLKADNDQLRAQFNHLSENYQKANERELKKAADEYQNIIKELKAEKVQAMDEGDHQRVVDIDEQMRSTPEPQEEKQEKPDYAAADEAIAKWKTDNTWYEEDEALGEQADMLASQYAKRNIPLNDALPKISQRMKELFPHKFENKRRQSAASVERGGSPQPSAGKVSEKRLTKEELEMYRDLGMEQVLKTDAAKKKYFQNVIDSRD